MTFFFEDRNVYEIMWKTMVVLLDVVQQQHVRQPSTYANPEAACAVLGS